MSQGRQEAILWIPLWPHQDPPFNSIYWPGVQGNVTVIVTGPILWLIGFVNLRPGVGNRVPGFDWVRPVPIKKINQWAAVSFLWAGAAKNQNKKKTCIITAIRPKMRWPTGKMPGMPYGQSSHGWKAVSRKMGKRIHVCASRRKKVYVFCVIRQCR